MSYMEAYKEWCTNPYFDENTKAELAAIKDNAAEIEDRFYRQLEFGTGGLRGVIGAGTNRMNIYTVRKAHRDWRIISAKWEHRQKVLPSRMIPDICPRSSPTRRRFVLQRTALRHMYLNR